MGQYELLLARKESLMEQMKKLDEKEAVIHEQKKKTSAILKEVLKKIEMEDLRKYAEKNKKIMDAVESTFGEVTEENYETFLDSMKDTFGEREEKKIDGTEMMNHESEQGF
ncbi:MAG: hypothetical protein PUB46_02230 [Lachnospiraceae bacterium]|nr:hypothetical protein [Lachnospiraceae bacterium]